MNKWIKRGMTGVLAITGLVGVLCAGISAMDKPLPLGAEPAGLTGQWPDAHPPYGLDFTVIHTGESKPVAEALILGGGSWLVQRRPSQNAVLIRHPKGQLLFDTGFGRQVQQQFEVNTWLNRQFFAFGHVNPAIDQLQSKGWSQQAIRLIVPSHMHWDHVSALPDFPDAQVWVPRIEREEAARGHAPAFIQSQFSGVQHWQDLTFDPNPYMGYPVSRDMFGDGSVVFVPLGGGHTVGQIGMFLNLPSGQHYFFTGDVTWTLEGLQRATDRSWALRHVVHVDHDERANQAAIVQIHHLMQRYPSLKVVPAHDEHVLQTLPRFPNVQN